MSDIIADINRRISEAEGARDSARAELEALKAVLKNNGVVVRDKTAFVFLGSGFYQGSFCTDCPFVKWGSADSCSCTIGADSCRCMDRGGRYYTIREIKDNFKSQMREEHDFGTLQAEICDMQNDMAKIADIAKKRLDQAEKGGAK